MRVLIVKGEGLLKVIGSHIHWKSGNKQCYSML